MTSTNPTPVRVIIELDLIPDINYGVVNFDDLKRAAMFIKNNVSSEVYEQLKNEYNFDVLQLAIDWTE